MINFRFHIVSLTAVLLSLGIGLVLGTTFLDDATINQLERQLDGLEHDLDRSRARNDEQQARLGAFEDEAEQLEAQLGERLYAGELEDEPVLVVSTRGIDQRWVDTVLTSLTQADADVVGVWWLTERNDLDDDSEVGDLAEALELSTDEPERLSRTLAVQLGGVLYGAADVASTAEQAEVAVDPAQLAPAEPALLARLREHGFVEYQLAEGAEGDVVRLPVSDLRIVVVDGPDAAVPATQVVLPVLDELTVDGAMPVVVAQPTPATGDDVDEAAQPQLVGAIRDDDELGQRVSTVDDLERVSGRVATLLATVDAVPGEPTIGRYGTGDGADRMLPPAAGEG